MASVEIYRNAYRIQAETLDDSEILYTPTILPSPFIVAIEDDSKMAYAVWCMRRKLGQLECETLTSVRHIKEESVLPIKDSDRFPGDLF